MHKYNPKQIHWLSCHAAGTTYTRLTEMFNRRFRLALSTEQIRNACRYYGFSVSPAYHKYTDAEIRFIKKNIAGRNYADLTALFNKRFGTSLTVDSVSGAAHSRGLSNFLPSNVFQKGCSSWMKGTHRFNGPKEAQFQKGYTPYIKKPIGSETLSNGYIFVKTAEPDVWEKKHRVIWEAANGPVPKGHAVIFADRNTRNFSLDNLLLVSPRELGSMNRNSLISTDRDLTKAGKLVADIRLLIADRKRAVNKQKRPGKEENER